MARLRIGQLLMEAGLLSKAQLDEALAAQQIYGGRLGTVIVEHGFVSEDALAHALASQLGLREVSGAFLENIPRDIVALLSPAQAERYQVIPFRLDGDGIGIHLAMTDPGNLERADEIRFALGRKVEMFLCPEIAMARGLETHYGIKRRQRFIRLKEPADSLVARAREVAAASPTPPPVSIAKPAATPGLLSRVAGATTPQSLIETMLDALNEFSTTVLFLAVRPDGLEGWSGRGLDVPPATLPTLRVRIEDSALLRQAFGSQHASRCDLSFDPGLGAPLGARAGIRAGEPVIVVPLIVGDCPYGAFVMARAKPGRNADPTLLSELVRRAGWRLQAIQLMEHVTAPLAGCP